MTRAPETSRRPAARVRRASGPALAWRRIAARKRAAGGLGGAAGDVGLARGGGLAGVGGERGVGAEEREGGDRQAEGVGADLRDDRVRALAHVGGALVQHERAVGAEADADGRGIGQRGVAAAVPAAGDADAAACGPPAALAAAASARARVQGARSAARQSPMPTPCSTWPVAVASPSWSAFSARNSRRSRPAASARRSISASPAIAAWGTPKPRKAPETGSWVWMARARARTCGHAVGAGGVDRHAVGDGRAPAGVGAGVEDAFELERGEAARRRRSRAGRRCARGGAWWWTTMDSAAREGHAHRAAGLERGEAEQRLHARCRACRRSRRRWRRG